MDRRTNNFELHVTSVNLDYNSIPNRYGWNDAEPAQTHTYLLPEIIRCLPACKLRVIDIGSGNGHVAGRLSELDHEVVGIKPSEDGINLARERYPHIKFVHKSIYEHFNCENSCSIGDIVIAAEVIEHLYYPRKLLQRAFQMLKPGGVLVVTTPYHGYLKNIAISLLNGWDTHFTAAWDGGHIKFFSKRTLSTMIIGAGFRKPNFLYTGRFFFIWKSMVCVAIRP